MQAGEGLHSAVGHICVELVDREAVLKQQELLVNTVIGVLQTKTVIARGKEQSCASSSDWSDMMLCIPPLLYQLCGGVTRGSRVGCGIGSDKRHFLE